MNFKYFMPTEVYFGEDVVLKNQDQLKKLGQKALIVTGKNSAQKSGAYDDITKALASTGIDYVLFDQVEENPSLETVENGAALGKKNNADFVIGIGGGSPIDAAKAMAVFIKNPAVTAENIFGEKDLENVPVVAIATTSGTGSEVTQYSIVTSNKEKTKKNLGQRIFPHIAFVDSKYTHNLPYDITVNTAIDAFTHLVEGYLNKNSTFMSDIYGEKGFELSAICFEKLADKNLDHEFREKVMLASTLGGIQIALAGTSLPHGMGYPLTYFKGLPHGLANGVLTIGYLKSFKDHSKIDKMLSILGFSDLNQLDAAFKKLFTVDIDVTQEEILEYAKSFMNQKEKLKSHTEDVGLEDIIEIYSNSLLK